ncbi:hypothetical protein [Novosphingobium album (ex Hu et al. 2023)]|uniref:Lipoprotein n=1 Tax=Novosphingobium album (ex Hu et al. 2023) TaxID=2930093 RepID=A0ABT0B4D6_9SPHN|nr:hypothetical protein [Novosphingobium album (ex Hu et al. 2023)]MCJ2179922.1 hypothetical protein [Novosphingobium album (ex Hu et al. 2023)]
MKIPALFPALALGILPLVSGCISTATKVVTAPVRVTSKAVDMATTSQSEADENRGRRMREHEEKLGKAQRSYEKHMRECDQGDDRACLKARDDNADIQHLRASSPY